MYDNVANESSVIKPESSKTKNRSNLPNGNDCRFGRLGAGDAANAVARFSMDPMLRSVWLLQEQDRCFGRTGTRGADGDGGGDRSLRIASISTVLDIVATTCD